MLTRRGVPILSSQRARRAARSRPDGLPTYDELVAIRYAPSVILDAAVEVQGRLLHGYEVIHTHGVTPKKEYWLKILAQHHVHTHVFDAEWVLCQVGIPKEYKILHTY